MAPPRTPTRLKLLRGETRPSRLNHREPRPRRSLPKMPADMSASAKVVWRRILREMGATGVITAADSDMLRVYCEAASRYVYAATTLERVGPLLTAGGRGGRRGELVKNPLHQVVRDNAVLLRGFARELGLTPAARAGLTGQGHEEADPFADFLDGAS